MDKLDDFVLLHILRRLDDSTDVARCRVAWKAFDAVFPGLGSIHLHCKTNSNSSSRSRDYFMKILTYLISKLETVESVSINILDDDDDFILTDQDFVKDWMSRVSGSLKSLSVSGVSYSQLKPHVLPLISAYCGHNLLHLNLRYGYFSVHPMPMLTSLTLESTRVDDDKHLNDQLNNFFPNLQLLNLITIIGLKNLNLHILSLKTFNWVVIEPLPYSLTLITPNLTTLEIDCSMPPAIHLEAPMLSHFHLTIYANSKPPARTFAVKKFENLKALSLDSCYIGSLLSEFPILKSLETLALCSHPELTSCDHDAPYSKLTLAKVFTVFPNVSSLRISSGVWYELEACLDPEGWEINLDGRKGLKALRAYLMLANPSLTFSFVARVLNQCVGLSDVSLLIHSDVSYNKSTKFMSKCMARWPGLKWRWGRW